MPPEGARPWWRRLEQCWQSPLDPTRRYALQGDLFYKIGLGDAAGLAPMRRQGLGGEARILRHCQGIAGVPELIAWIDAGALRILVTRRLFARPLSQLEVGPGQWLKLTLRLAHLIVRLARRGVSHDDLRPENVLVDPAGRVHLIDFDQASSGGFAVCLGRSLLGLRLGGGAVSNSVLAHLRERLQTRLPPAVLRTLRDRRRRPRPDQTPQAMPAGAGPELTALDAAWQAAARSDASSPGRPIAYYALAFGGVRFPGERAWAERWGALRWITEYRGRRVLELGCNLGLLSTFLLREGGAAATLAVDRDQAILEAAATAAQAFHVRPGFRPVDFDAAADWEAGLLAFRPDVVFALSIGHWVRDQARFHRFLGRFEELIYEGHDSARTERARLGAAGFGAIELVGTSERGRAILHCRKTAGR